MRPTALMLRVQARRAEAEGDHAAATAAADKAVALATAVGGRENRQRTNFYPTPPELAAELAELLADNVRSDGPLLLEPSAGNGNLVRAMQDAFHPRNYHITAIEPEHGLADHIDKHYRTDVKRMTFENYGPHVYSQPDGATLAFDGVLMNPPFSVPGNRTIWIDHVRKAWDSLVTGGTLVAVVPGGFTFREDRRHREIRALVAQHGGHYDLPDDAFAISGTSVRTVAIWATKP
ncbi:hypothetical protein [Amycolatopsis kentuckyensis]|uniref:hypothetical protein n=1 Tax=Amycolatopsis kentuckyensis TaxID=218823 RepID=UPI003563D8F3